MNRKVGTTLTHKHKDCHLMIRTDWTLEEITEIYDQPLLELVHRAQVIHRQNFDPLKV